MASLGTGYVYFLWFLIGSWCCSRLLWLARVVFFFFFFTTFNWKPLELVIHEPGTLVVLLNSGLAAHIRLRCKLVPRVSPSGNEVVLGGVHGEGCRRDIAPRIETGDHKASTYWLFTFWCILFYLLLKIQSIDAIDLFQPSFGQYCPGPSCWKTDWR